MSSDCIFCKIIAGELPCSKVYEDDDTIAFMDIGPVSKGHTLVIPKLHCDPITNTPPATLQKLILSVQRIAAAQFKGLNAEGITVTQANGEAAGQVVPHIHFHVIPRYAGEAQPRNWIPINYDSTEEMEQFAEKIRSALND
jgi:histidine triad (HIT) family protein